MVNRRFPDRPAAMRSRLIAPSDREALVGLLNKGFGWRRSRRFWRRMLDRLERRPIPDGMPQYGYLLENAGRPVGAILLICAPSHSGTKAVGIRCNPSSWYVEPAFRSYASLLAAQALRHKSVTYLNISPAPNTRETIEVQGYRRYSGGLFIAAPALQVLTGAGARIVPADCHPDASSECFERELVGRHAAYGCLAFWCIADGRAYPFVFRRGFLKGVLPCAQLIYCRDIADIVRFAGPIGWHLLLHGCLLVTIDANGPIPGLGGWYVEDLKPKYFKGAEAPRLGDLADTEAALFGI
jgi:hypothetical protein